MNKSMMMFIFSGIVVMALVFFVVLLSINGLQKENMALKETLKKQEISNNPCVKSIVEYDNLIKYDNCEYYSDGTYQCWYKHGSTAVFDSNNTIIWSTGS